MKPVHDNPIDLWLLKKRQTEFTRRRTRAWHAGGLQCAKAIGLAPFAAWEQSMRPILEYVVPRQKLGVFADMAKRELIRLGPGATEADTREALRKARDSVDNRMGQVVYDNLFYNRTVKDVALLSFRAYGWQLGKYQFQVTMLSSESAVRVWRVATPEERSQITHLVLSKVANSRSLTDEEKLKFGAELLGRTVPTR